jgi:hypothetical protein
MVLTKLLICLIRGSGYTNTLAEPRYIVRHGESAIRSMHAHLPPNEDASRAIDPRLGTRSSPALRRDLSTPVAWLKFLGRSGARFRQAYGAAGSRPTKNVVT